MITSPPEGYVVTSHGLRRADDPKVEDEGPPNWVQVFLATNYLKKNWVPSKGRIHNSYWLKGEAERHALPARSSYYYISNGALVGAALALGFRIRVFPGPNGYVEVFASRPKGFPGPWCERLSCSGGGPSPRARKP